MTKRGRPKKIKGQYSDDARIAAKQMANDLAHNSIVTKALARYIEQIMESINEDVIQPLRDQIDRQREALEFLRKPGDLQATSARAGVRAGRPEL